jgi:multidrug efflux pump subunit AcrA (membrane-fusion protein)
MVTFLRDGVEEEPRPARPVALGPWAAVRTAADRQYVFVVENDLVERRAVTTGGADGDRLEVLAGLGAGERVVVSPPAELAGGMAVITR